MIRYRLEPDFREKMFRRAVQEEGSETYVGRLLGYSINYGFRARQLRRGEIALSKEQLMTLSGITGISMEEILHHVVQEVDRKRRGTRP